MKICHGLLGSSNLVIMVPPPHSEWKIKLSWTNWTSDLERIVSPPPNENFSWITDNLAFIFGAGQCVRLSCTPDLGCLVVVEKIDTLMLAFTKQSFQLYLIFVYLIFITQVICNGNETFSLLGSRFILRGQDWSHEVKPLYQQLPLQLAISWISQRRPIKSNLLVNWINWVNVI